MNLKVDMAQAYRKGKESVVEHLKVDMKAIYTVARDSKKQKNGDTI